MLEDRMRTPAGILLGLTLFIASGAGGAVQAASAQRVALGEVSAVIPAGCTPAKGKMGTVEIIDCTWKAEGGETRSFRLSRDIRKNDRMLKSMAGLGAESRRTMLSSSLPAWLNTVTSFGLPAELLPAKGYRVERQSVSDWPASGPNGMIGYCSAINLGSSGTSGRTDSKGLFCAAVGTAPTDLLTVSAMLSISYPEGAKPPADFSAAAGRIANSLTVGH